MRRMTSRRERDPGSDHCLIGDRLVGTSDFLFNNCLDELSKLLTEADASDIWGELD